MLLLVLLTFKLVGINNTILYNLIDIIMKILTFLEQNNVDSPGFVIVVHRLAATKPTLIQHAIEDKEQTSPEKALEPDEN